MGKKNFTQKQAGMTENVVRITRVLQIVPRQETIEHDRSLEQLTKNRAGF